MTLDEFFEGYPESRTLFDALCAMIEAQGAVTLRVSKSQIAFRRRKAFAWAWIPGRYLHGHSAPLVLSLALPARDPSPRWKEVVEPARGQFMHHLELHRAADLDTEAAAWIGAAAQWAA